MKKTTTRFVLPAAMLLPLGASAGASITAYATQVEQFSQGFRKNGTAVDANRSITSNALGAPQNNDTINFTSLGFGGSMILSFGGVFGGTVSVWETTYGNPASYPERANVFVGAGATWDTADYYLVGLLPNTADGAPMSLASIESTFGVDRFRFVKLVDATSLSSHGATADGFDVDGVSVQLIPAPGAAALAACGLVIAGRRRRA